MRFFATFLIVLLSGFCVQNRLHSQTANPLDLHPPVVGYEYRLGIAASPHAQGMLVTSIEPRSPTLSMRSIDGRYQGIMEIDDVISHVNGIKVANLDEIHRALDRSQGKVRLSVVNVATGETQQWDVDPIQVTVRANRQPRPFNPNEKPFLFAFLIADTHDGTIGQGAKQSLQQLEQVLRTLVNEDQLKVTVLEGDRCNAEEIIEALALVPSSELDSILVYFLGHGAYDPRFAQNDPSGGHFLDFDAMDVMRRTVWEYLEAAPAKLRMVVSDACNVQSEADPFEYRMETRRRLVPFRGPTDLEWLLLGHRGKLDLTASSRNEYAWYSNSTGGFFSEQWLKLTSKPPAKEWAPFLADLRIQANQHYQEQREKILASPGDTPASTLERLRQQTTMYPTTFRNQLERESTPPVSPNLERMLAETYMVKIPFTRQ